MWTVLWRPALGLVGLGASGVGTLAVMEKWADPLWLKLLNAGGWFLVAVLALVSFGLLVAGAWPLIRFVRGPDERPWEHDRRVKLRKT